MSQDPLHGFTVAAIRTLPLVGRLSCSCGWTRGVQPAGLFEATRRAEQHRLGRVALSHVVTYTETLETVHRLSGVNEHRGEDA